MTTAAPMPTPRFIAFDDDGKPLAGGKVLTYAPGTTNPSPTYSDAAGTITNPWPVVLDAGGQASIFILDGDQGYTIEIQSAGGEVIWTENQVSTLKGVKGTDGGAKGNQGIQGDQGPQGKQGPQGNTGDRGDTGDVATIGSGLAVFMAAGTYNWIVPDNAYTCLISLCGGGGGGCSGNDSTASLTTNPVGGAGGGGGGHGHLQIFQPFNVTPGDTLKIVVGNGGITDQDGKLSSVQRVGDVSPLISAAGGSAGVYFTDVEQPLGAWSSFPPTCLILGPNDPTEPMHIISIATGGGHGATGPWGMGGMGGAPGIAPDTPVTHYYRPAFNGGIGSDAVGNGSGGGGGGGGATYYYGNGISDPSPVDTFKELPRQLLPIECTPQLGNGAQGGNGADGIVEITYYVKAP